MNISTQWDLTKLGSSLDDPVFTKERTSVLRAYKAFRKKWKYDQSYLTKVGSLKQVLSEYEILSQKGGAESLYLFLRSCLDSSDTDVQAAMTRYRDVVHICLDEIRFFELSLGTISKKKQKQFLTSPQLTEYRQYLRSIFDHAQYLLSEKEERILDVKSSVSSGNWVDMLEEFLSTETRSCFIKDASSKKIVSKEQTLTELLKHVRSGNKKISESAQKGIEDILDQHKKVAEKEMNSFLENKKINDTLRNFERPDTARHLAEHIPTKAVDSLVKVVTDNMDISRSFYRFKTQLLNKDTLTYWNRLQEYGRINKEYSYEDSAALVQKAFGLIHQDFVDIFNGMVSSGTIDVYPKKGKRGGAFCLGEYGFNVRVMLNHKGTLRDVTTLAHEIGHAIHATKARKENALNYNPPMCTAEVASTFCEDFVVDTLQEEADDELRFRIMLSQLEDKVSTIFRQIAGYSFESELHSQFREKGYVPENEIGTLFNAHMKSYLGTSVTLDASSGRGWMYWSHFRTPFYVYSYAMASLVSQAAKKRLQDNPEYISKIIQFYETGSSKSPQEVFSDLGMNITGTKLWEEGVQEVRDLLKKTKKMARKLGKI